MRLDSWQGQGRDSFLFNTASRPTLGPTQPPIPSAPGALSPGVKRSDVVADRSPSPSAEVKDVWSYTSTSSYVFIV
jgi:hypothetical protein